MFLLSILFSSKMVLVPLDSWRFISVVDTGSSEWYANTTLVAPTYNKRAMQIKGRYTRGILHSPGARPGSKAPPCVPMISWVYSVLHPPEQNSHPAKCSTIFNWLNIWEQAPRANWALYFMLHWFTLWKFIFKFSITSKKHSFPMFDPKTLMNFT